MTFYVFFKLAHQKVVKNVSISLVINPSKWVYILRSVIAEIQFPAPGVWSILSHCWMWMSIEISASKFPDVMGTYSLRLSCTVQSCKVSRTSAFLTKMFDVGDLLVPTFHNWVLKAKWLSGLWNYTYASYVFWVAAHIFSNTGPDFEALDQYQCQYQCQCQCQCQLIYNGALSHSASNALGAPSTAETDVS